VNCTYSGPTVGVGTVGTVGMYLTNPACILEGSGPGGGAFGPSLTGRLVGTGLGDLFIVMGLDPFGPPLTVITAGWTQDLLGSSNQVVASLESFGTQQAQFSSAPIGSSGGVFGP